MTLLFLISSAITVFLLAAVLIVMMGGSEGVDARLVEIAARPKRAGAATWADTPKSGLAQVAAILTGPVKPIRELISGSDDMTYRLMLAGFRKAEHVEVYTAAKMLLPHPRCPALLSKRCGLKQCSTRSLVVNLNRHRPMVADEPCQCQSKRSSDSWASVTG